MQSLETCPRCKSNLDMDSVFCPECGYKVMKQEITQPLELTPRRLPFGLELLIALGAFGALFYFGSSIIAFWAASTIFRLSEEISQVLVATGVVWLLVALCQVTTSWGLWALKEWARKAMVLVAILDLVGAFLNPIYGVVGLVFSIIVIAYLYTPHVDALFSSRKGERGRIKVKESLSCGTCILFRKIALCPRREINKSAEVCAYYQGKIKHRRATSE